MSHSAVIFDLDGTLINTLEDIACSINNVLNKLGVPPHPINTYRNFIGGGVEALVKQSLPKKLLRKDIISNCIVDFNKEYSIMLTKKSCPYDGVIELLKKLKMLNIETAVHSNKPDAYTQTIVSELLNNHRFAFAAGARQGFPKKPDPKVARHICMLFKVEPSKVVYVGDTETDMLTAKNAGMFPVGVSWGFRDINILRDSGAKVIINKPMELFNVF